MLQAEKSLDIPLKQVEIYNDNIGTVLQQINLAGSDADVALWIWENLVLAQEGAEQQATSLQGEVIRAIELLAWEAKNCGNLNWSYQFEQLLTFLKWTFLNSNSPLFHFFNEDVRNEINTDLERLTHFILPTELDSRVYISELPYDRDDLYDRLTQHLIHFCRVYPKVLPL